jgi:hypothetical protein
MANTTKCEYCGTPVVTEDRLWAVCEGVKCKALAGTATDEEYSEAMRQVNAIPGEGRTTCDHCGNRTAGPEFSVCDRAWCRQRAYGD